MKSTDSAQYGVCVFRDTGLDDTAHVEFSRRLGELDDVKRYMVGGRKLRYQYYELFDAGNLDAENNLLDPDSPRAHANRVSLSPPPLLLLTPLSPILFSRRRIPICARGAREKRKAGDCLSGERPY